MIHEALFLLATVLAFSVALMWVTWVVAWHVRNLGLVDVSWSFGFIPAALFYSIAAPGLEARKIKVATLAIIWGGRLAWHVGSRVMRQHPREDARYAVLRSKWALHLHWKTFLFFQLQAVLLALLSLVFLIPCMNDSKSTHDLEWLGLVMGLMAIAGESLADFQLSKFRLNPVNHGKVCQTGLWRYSRHPNYFFEWMAWVGFFVMDLGSPWGWIAFMSPAFMLYFLLQVTGIPPTEELLLKSKGNAYREYQESTNAFIPWPRKYRAKAK